MTRQGFRKNLDTILLCGLMSLSVFICGIGLLSVIPVPIHLRGGLVTDMVTVGSAKEGGYVVISTKADMPTILIFDDQGQSVFSLSVSKIGGVFNADITSPAGEPLLRINSHNGRASVTVLDSETGKVAWEVVGDAENSVRVPGR